MWMAELARKTATADSRMGSHNCVSAVMLASRGWRRRLRHCVNDEIDCELRVIACAKALVAPVVIPVPAVILVRIDDTQPASPLDAAQVIVHHVIAPAIQFLAGLRRSLRVTEKRAVQWMAVGDLRQHIGALEGAAHLALERLCEQTVDVVIAIVGE